MDTETYTEDHPPENIIPEKIKVVRFSRPVVGLLLILSNGVPVALILFALIYSRSSFENILFFTLAGYISGLCFFLLIFPKKWLLRCILIVIYSIAFLGIVIPWAGGMAGIG